MRAIDHLSISWRITLGLLVVALGSAGIGVVAGGGRLGLPLALGLAGATLLALAGGWLVSRLVRAATGQLTAEAARLAQAVQRGAPGPGGQTRRSVARSD